MIDNHYRTLGLDNFTSIDEVKRAYRQLAKKYHPDRNPEKEEVFKRVNEANRILSDINKKAIYDNTLKYGSNSNTTTPYPNYNQPKPRYSQPKYEYSKKVKIYGAIFVFGLICLCIGGPIALSYYSSNYAYEEGIRLQHQNNYREAASSYRRAIKYFSTKSGQASIKLSQMCLYDLNNPLRAIQYVDEGLFYTDKDNEKAELYFIKANALKKDGQAELSRTTFQISLIHGYNADSINLNIGLLDAFYLDAFDSAIVRFEHLLNNKLVNQEAFFGKAWCLQKSKKHVEAIDAFSTLIKNYPNNAPGYYYKGLSELTIGDSVEACNSIKKANELNYPLASKIIEFVCI